MSSPDTPTKVTQVRHIAGATVVMAVAMMASRILGLVRNAVVSHRLGQGYMADLYVGAFQLPDLLFYLVAGGALSSAFIPVFTEKLTLDKKDEAWRLFSTVSCVMFVVVAAFVVLGEIFTYPLVKIVNPGFSAAKVAATVPLTRVILPAQLAFFLGGLMMGVQYSLGRYRTAALGPNIYNLGIIFGGVVLTHWMGVRGLLWGALGGAVVGNFAVQLHAVKRLGMRFTPNLNARDPDAMRVWKLMLPVVLGVALPQVSIWINRAFASSLGDGPQAAVTNAANVMQVPLGVLGQAMAVAIFPTLSALAAAGKKAEFRATSIMAVRSLFFLTLPLQMFMLALSVPITQVLYQHGKFHAADTELAAMALRYYSIGTFAWCIQSVLSRSFYSLHDTITPVVVGSGVTFIFIPMNWIFIHNLHMGLKGVAMATSIAAILHAVAMAWVLRGRMEGLEDRRLALSLGRSTLAGAAAFLACLAGDALALRLLPAAHSVLSMKVHALGELVAGMGLGTAAFVLVAVLLRSEETREVLAMFRRKSSEPAPEPA